MRETYVNVFLKAQPRAGSECRKDRTLRTALRDILVLQVLRRCKSVVLVEEHALVNGVVPSSSFGQHTFGKRGRQGNSLPIPRPNDANPTPGHVPKPHMEPTEVVSDDHEQPKRLLGILNLGEEVGREAEAQRDLGGLVEVGLEDAPGDRRASLVSVRIFATARRGTRGRRGGGKERRVLVEDQETLQHLEVELIRHGPPELVVQLAIRERLDSLETLVGERRSLVAGVLGGRVMRHREVDVEKADLHGVVC